MAKIALLPLGDLVLTAGPDVCAIHQCGEAVRREVKPRVILYIYERRLRYRDVLGRLLLCI